MSMPSVSHKILMIIMIVFLVLAIAQYNKTFLAEGKSDMKIENANSNPSKAAILDNLDRYRIMDPLFEGVRIIMSYRGEKYSPEYIQGISGAAFRISGICPCATTCSWMMNPYDLPKLLGYQTDCLFLNQEKGKKAVLNDIIAQVKEEIRAGRPVLVWNAFTTAEWDVVCGYDDEKKQFIGRGSYEGLDGYAIADENRTAEWIPSWPSAIFIKDKVDEFNAHEAEIASLKEAVKHAHTIKEIPSSDGKWVRLEGLQCYDRWVNDYQDPNKKRDIGDLCCISTYRSTHRAAGGFMKELMPKYPEAKENLEKASEYFIAEANALDQCDSLIGHNTPEGPDADRNTKTAKLLKQARDNYSSAINEIEEAVKKIEARIPKIVKKDAFLVAGLRYEGKNGNNEIPAIWHTFINRVNELGLDNTKPMTAYGVSRGIPNAEPGVFEYLSAVDVKSITNLPKEMVGWKIPEQTYAVFPVYGLSDIGHIMDFCYKEWLPQSKEYVCVDSPMFEYYPETHSQDSILYIHVPIKHR